MGTLSGGLFSFSKIKEILGLLRTGVWTSGTSTARGTIFFKMMAFLTGAAGVVFGQTSGNVFGRSEPDFRLDDFEGLVSEVLGPDRWTAPPDRVRRSDMSMVGLSFRRGRLLRLAPTRRFAASNVQITRPASEKAEVTQGRRPTPLCRHRFYAKRKAKACPSSDVVSSLCAAPGRDVAAEG